MQKICKKIRRKFLLSSNVKFQKSFNIGMEWLDDVNCQLWYFSSLDCIGVIFRNMIKYDFPIGWFYITIFATYFVGILVNVLNVLDESLWPIFSFKTPRAQPTFVRFGGSMLFCLMHCHTNFFRKFFAANITGKWCLLLLMHSGLKWKNGAARNRCVSVRGAICSISTLFYCLLNYM